MSPKWAAALVGGVHCAGVAVRRRWPVVVGFGTQLMLTLTSSRLHPSTSPGAALGIGAAIVMGLVRLARELHDVIGQHVSTMVFTPAPSGGCCPRTRPRPGRCSAPSSESAGRRWTMRRPVR